VATQVDIGDIQTTRGEKLLAVVMTVFLLIGGIWAYDRLEIRNSYAPPSYTRAERIAISQNDAAQNRLFAAQERVVNEQSQLELAREAYRTAIEAHQPSAALGARYRRETTQFNAAQAAVRRARAEVRATDAAASAARDRAAREQRRHVDRNDRETFLLRLAFVLAAIACSFFAFRRLRRSRYLPLASAAVATAAILALVMAGDYIGDYVRWQDLGPLVLSVVGVAFTVSAFWGLQRYLAQRIPRWRVRRSECPFCGYPVKAGPHCEGCGRDIVAECAKCSAPRRVGTVFCASCGGS
jgi:hypothetical protein